jgi:hypothetical protein
VRRRERERDVNLRDPPPATEEKRNKSKIGKEKKKKKMLEKAHAGPLAAGCL